MTWIRYQGERDFIDLFISLERQKRLHLGEAYLILVQPHPFPCNRCQSFLSHFSNAVEEVGDIKARLLVIGENLPSHDRLTRQELITIPEDNLAKGLLQESLGIYSDETSVFLFDPYGSLWFAWSGDDLDIGLVQNILQWLAYLDIQCPE